MLLKKIQTYIYMSICLIMILASSVYGDEQLELMMNQMENKKQRTNYKKTTDENVIKWESYKSKFDRTYDIQINKDQDEINSIIIRFVSKYK